VSGALIPTPSRSTPAAQRGGLDIAPTVVERVAEGTARLVPGVQLVHRRVGADRLRTSARVLGSTASLTLDIAVRYPSPVRATARRVRDEVGREVQRLTGVEVGRLDLAVVQLPSTGGRGRRVR